MATDTYEVLVDELTVHREVGLLTDPISGQVTGVQQGKGKTYFKGEKIAAKDVSPLLRDALEDEDSELYPSVSKKLRKSSDAPSENTAMRLGVPFAGYGDMDEDNIVALMASLPSATIQAIKRYEAQQEEPRDQIVNYSIGFAQSPSDRQEGRLSSPLDDADEDKTVGRLTTREVPEEGLVQIGDGITGTGDPQIPHGSAAKEDDDDDSPASARRRSRRPAKGAKARKKPEQAPGAPEGSGDSE